MWHGKVSTLTAAFLARNAAFAKHVASSRLTRIIQSILSTMLKVGTFVTCHQLHNVLPKPGGRLNILCPVALQFVQPNFLG
jgi:hypothetical protein